MEQRTFGQKFERFVRNSGFFVGLVSWGAVVIFVLASLQDDNDARGVPTQPVIESQD